MTEMLTCVACGQPFSFSPAEQEKFRIRHWTWPTRCYRCRQDAKQRDEERGARQVDALSAYDATRQANRDRMKGKR